MSVAQKIRSILLRIGGYLVPLFQDIPPIGTYHMILPVISTLALFILDFNLNNWRWGIPIQRIPVGPLRDNWRWGIPIGRIPVGPLRWTLLGTGVCMAGLSLALYSIVYLGLHKKAGLVTTGPYRFVRHPQYSGFLLLTLGLTGWSYWVHKHFCGGWLTPCQTVLLWYAELGTYIGLALVEESYLSKEFGYAYATYKRTASFFLPFGNKRRYDLLLSIVGLSLLLFVLLFPSFSIPPHSNPS